MALAEDTREGSFPVEKRWYALKPEDVAAAQGVAVASGLAASEARVRLGRDGPNALPVEQPPSALRRFLAEYTSYMQLILVGGPIVSFAIKEWTTAVGADRDLLVQRGGGAAPSRARPRAP